MRRIALLITTAFFLLFSYFLVRNYIGEQFFPQKLSTHFVDAVSSFQEIKLPFFYGRTFNPGIVEVPEGYVLSFRSNANGIASWIKHNLLLDRKIYLNFLFLDRQFLPQGEISTYADAGQDARLIRVGEDFYAVYNDEVEEDGKRVRRMYCAKFALVDTKVYLAEGKKLIFPQTTLFAKRGLITADREKNWSPFVWEGKLHFVYLIAPHVIIKADLDTGLCTEVVENPPLSFWEFNAPCGGTPALRVGDEYLSFFHAHTPTENRWRKTLQRGGYYFGAYTFSAEFPFQIIRRTKLPLYPGKLPWARRKIVYPTGLIEGEDHYLLFAGVTDKKVYLFRLHKEKMGFLLEKV